MILLGAVAAAAFASLFADLNQLDLANRALDGERVGLAEASDSDDAVALTATIYLIAVVLAAITFLLWYARAHRNIPSLVRDESKYGPRWAIAYWFIPIVNLFRPKQVVDEAWRAGDPTATPSNWRTLPVPALLQLWWGAWLIDILVTRYVSTIEGRAVVDIKDLFTGFVIIDILDIVAAILAILVIRSTTARQEARRREMELDPGASAAGGPVPDPVPAGG